MGTGWILSLVPPLTFPRLSPSATIGAEVMAMRLANYHFGRIEADGVAYEHDLLVTPTGVQEWRRREGHRVHPEDLEPALVVSPDVVVVGTGFSGFLTLTEEARARLAERKIELIAVRTGEAVEAYNELSPARRTCALLHLTC